MLQPAGIVLAGHLLYGSHYRMEIVLQDATGAGLRGGTSLLTCPIPQPSYRTPVLKWAGPPTVPHDTTLWLLGAEQELLPAYGCCPCCLWVGSGTLSGFHACGVQTGEFQVENTNGRATLLCILTGKAGDKSE